MTLIAICREKGESIRGDLTCEHPWYYIKFVNDLWPSKTMDEVWQAYRSYS